MHAQAAGPGRRGGRDGPLAADGEADRLAGLCAGQVAVRAVDAQVAVDAVRCRLAAANHLPAQAVGQDRSRGRVRLAGALRRAVGCIPFSSTVAPVPMSSTAMLCCTRPPVFW